MVQCNRGGWVGWLDKYLQVPPTHKKSQFHFFDVSSFKGEKMQEANDAMESMSSTSGLNTETITDTAPKKRGRPKGSVKMTLQRVAKNPGLLKTDGDRLKELKGLLISSRGKDVVEKALEIAMNDDHPAQAAMIKLCMDRTLPVSFFERDKQQRSAVTINITGLGSEPTVIEGDVTDV
jgi:hypothetical protein